MACLIIFTFFISQAKKLERHLKKHQLGGFGYTDDDNPFGDHNLSERFVWGRKIEKQIAEGMDVHDMTAKAEQRRQAERLEEIEKVKKRREQREAERAAMAEELELIQRERAMAEAVDLERKEEEFHLEQAKVRARQRLAEGRPKAIDLITNNLFLLDGFDPTEDDPAAILSTLNLPQLRELQGDIKEYRELDARDASHNAFWAALGVVAEHELAEATKQEDIDRARMRGLPPPAKYTIREAGWHESLDADVAVMLAGKRHSELVALEAGINEQLDSGEAADPEYWAAVLRRLQIYKARAVLREMHAEVMQRHLDQLMAGADVPKALVSGKQRAEQARLAAEEAEAETEAQLPLQGGDGAEAPGTGAGAGSAAEAAAPNAEEINLPDEEDHGLEGGAAPAQALPAPADDAELMALAAADIRMGHPGAGPSAAQEKADRDTERGEPRNWDDLDASEQSEHSMQPGEYSPRPLPPEQLVGQNVVPEEEDARMLELLRAQVKHKEAQRFKAAAASAVAAAAAGGGGVSAEADRLYRQMVANPRSSGPLLGATNPLLKYLVDAAPQGSGEGPSAADPEEARFRAAATRAMGGDMGTAGDAPFGGEVGVESQVYWWHEKYRPRKPKYFNRVHTGYDWNKYNKTHYDGDNPPPKVVQGYKFNIFYPDLIDPGKAPTYKIERDPSSEDGSTCIIRFSAGPPYEDIAFRIVNKDWATDPKRGFKCVFDRGILHLYFNFRRQFYRR